MSEFDPLKHTRGDLQHATRKDDEDEGIGLAEKSAPLMLRLLTSKQGSQWLMYGGIRGGSQSDDGKSFEFYYEGIMHFGDRRILGGWLVKVVGDNLELVCRQIGRGVKSSLKVGETANSQQPIKVASIVIEKLDVEPQDD